jgi:hypothetical protein
MPWVTYFDDGSIPGTREKEAEEHPAGEEAGPGSRSGEWMASSMKVRDFPASAGVLLFLKSKLRIGGCIVKAREGLS